MDKDLVKSLFLTFVEASVLLVALLVLVIKFGFPSWIIAGAGPISGLICFCNTIKLIEKKSNDT
jgi:hypothetical protein